MSGSNSKEKGIKYIKSQGIQHSGKVAVSCIKEGGGNDETFYLFRPTTLRNMAQVSVYLN